MNPPDARAPWSCGASGARTHTAASHSATTSLRRRYTQRPREAKRAAGTGEPYPWPAARPCTKPGDCDRRDELPITHRRCGGSHQSTLLVALLASGVPQPAGAAAGCTAHVTKLRYRPRDHLDVRGRVA